MSKQITAVLIVAILVSLPCLAGIVTGVFIAIRESVLGGLVVLAVSLITPIAIAVVASQRIEEIKNQDKDFFDKY